MDCFFYRSEVQIYVISNSWYKRNTKFIPIRKIWQNEKKYKTKTRERQIIHPKSETFGGDYFSAQKNWRKKCGNQDKNILWKKCVNRKNVMYLATK